jgi:hypothetical protein
MREAGRRLQDACGGCASRVLVGCDRLRNSGAQPWAQLGVCVAARFEKRRAERTYLGAGRRRQQLCAPAATADAAARRRARPGGRALPHDTTRHDTHAKHGRPSACRGQAVHEEEREEHALPCLGVYVRASTAIRSQGVPHTRRSSSTAISPSHSCRTPLPARPPKGSRRTTLPPARLRFDREVGRPGSRATSGAPEAWRRGGTARHRRSEQQGRPPGPFRPAARVSVSTQAKQYDPVQLLTRGVCEAPGAQQGQAVEVL